MVFQSTHPPVKTTQENTREEKRREGQRREDRQREREGERGRRRERGKEKEKRRGEIGEEISEAGEWGRNNGEEVTIKGWYKVHSRLTLTHNNSPTQACRAQQSPTP